MLFFARRDIPYQNVRLQDYSLDLTDRLLIRCCHDCTAPLYQFARYAVTVVPSYNKTDQYQDSDLGLSGTRLIIHYSTMSRLLALLEEKTASAIIYRGVRVPQYHFSTGLTFPVSTS